MDTEDCLLDMGDGPTDPRFAARRAPVAPPAPPVAAPPAPVAAGPVAVPAAAVGGWVGAVYVIAWFLRGMVLWARTTTGAATVAMYDDMRRRALLPAPSPVADVTPAPVAAAVESGADMAAALTVRAADTEASERAGVAFYALPGGMVALVAPFIRGPAGYAARPALKAVSGAVFERNVHPAPSARDGAWVMAATGMAAARGWCREHFGVTGGTLRGSDAAIAAVLRVLTEAERAAVGAPVVTAPPAPVAAPTAPVAPPVAAPAPGPSPEYLARVAAARARNAARGATAPAATVATGGNAAALASLDRALGGQTGLMAAPDAVDTVRAALTDGQLVAGARAEQQGALVGWTGRGELSRASIVAALRAAGAPADWAPKSKSAHAHAGAAVGKLSRAGLIPRVARDVTASDKRRGVASRWIVARAMTAGQVGDAAGRIAMTAELMQTGALVLDGDPELCTDVRADFDRLLAGELYAAADVTGWLAGVLRAQLGAVRLAQAWYVRHGNVEIAAAVCQAVSDVWGTDWLLPALPVATSAQLRAGLARGLITEARDVLDDLARQRKAATEAKRADIGPAAAATLLARLATVSDRAAQYAVILGAEHLGDIRKVLQAAIATVEPLADGTSQRGAMLELD